MSNKMKLPRRNFMQVAGCGVAAFGVNWLRATAAQEPIQGFEKVVADNDAGKEWKPVSDRRIRVGIVGYGVCRFETSYFHEGVYTMRQIYKSGGFGKLVYSEGEYYHYCPTPIPSYKGWRDGLPPQWYPTHSNAYYVGVTGGSFTEVSCSGMPSQLKWLQPENNRYKNPFGTEIASFRTSEGGMARMAVSWDTPGHAGEKGRVRGQKGSFSEAMNVREKMATHHCQCFMQEKYES